MLFVDEQQPVDVLWLCSELYGAFRQSESGWYDSDLYWYNHGLSATSTADL